MPVGPGDRILQRVQRLDAARPRPGRVVPERVVLALQPLARGRIGERDALGDDPAGAGGDRRGDQVARALRADAVVARLPAPPSCAGRFRRQVGQLVHDDVRLRRAPPPPAAPRRRTHRTPPAPRPPRGAPPRDRRGESCAVTSWPASTSSGTSRRPITPRRAGQEDLHAGSLSRRRRRAPAPSAVLTNGSVGRGQTPARRSSPGRASPGPCRRCRTGG